MAFVVRSERTLGPQKTATSENIGPGSYVAHNLSAKKKMSV